ncbi:MAG: tryptophan 7-halogenase [Verrucomicrobia bacterium]|nr:tryptophan 7-halogenase [Verrucomicrobiota bacterium]
MPELYDVIIVGGGPAGSTAGTLLAKQGWKVAIFEKEQFPRFKIGESLLPGSLCTFERMGVKEKIDRSEVIVKHGGKILSACGTRTNRFLFSNVFRCKYPTAYQVERSRFDQILLDHAAETGCEVRQGVKVTDFVWAQDGVRIRTATGEFGGRYLIDCSGRNSLVGTHFNLRRNYPELRKFSLYAHFEGVDRQPGIEGTLTQMVRGRDRWFWIIPITATKTSIGVVLDAQTFKRMKLSPEAAFQQILQENPKVTEQMPNARRVTEVYATGDFSFRNKSFTGDRWVLAGDAAGFIDPVWSSGVFIAVLSGEKAADMLDRVLQHPERRALEFKRYERHLGRVMDLYLRLVNSWYTQEFAEVFLHPQEFLQLVPAVNSLLAGSEKPLLQVRWRIWVFHLLVYLQKRFAIIAPRMSLQPNSQ